MRNTTLDQFDTIHLDSKTRRDMLFAGELFEEINDAYFRRLRQKNSLQKHWRFQRDKSFLDAEEAFS
jgi:hypothetical protein